jgi:hypothetical protein
MGKEIQLSTCRMWFDETLEIIRLEYARGSVTTIAGAKEQIKAFDEHFPGQQHPFLIDITRCKVVDREARAYFAGPEVRRRYTVMALLSKTPIGNIIANIWLSLYGHDHIKLFTSEREAIAWLKASAKE